MAQALLKYAKLLRKCGHKSLTKKSDRKSLMQLRQQIGLVFQNPEHQLVASTVEEDISYGLYNLGLRESEIAQQVQQAIEQFDLSELAREPIHNLSLTRKSGFPSPISWFWSRNCCC
ncbi:hypothetical protein [Microcoleus sp. Pol12B4]|uniref:hypothetical protein n=1 Tax=Microcoleus sp. Pol12B4 TaxID=3055395 RepID=UPI002FD1AFF1